MKNTLIFTYSTNILLGMFANCKCEELSYLKKSENVRPHYSQSSRENATSSSGTPPLAYYKEVPPPPAGVIVNSKLDYHPWPDPLPYPFLPPFDACYSVWYLWDQKESFDIISYDVWIKRVRSVVLKVKMVSYTKMQMRVISESLSFTCMAEGKRQIQVKNLSK